MPGLAGVMPSVLSFLSLRRFRFALGGLLTPQSLSHQFVGEHELCFAHFLDGKQDLGFFASRCVVAANAYGITLGA